MSILRSFQKKYIVFVLICCPHFMSAATFTWLGGTPDLNFTLNWTPPFVPTTGDTAQFANTGIHTPSLAPVLIPTFFTPDSIHFLAGSSTYLLSFDCGLGSTGMQISNGGITNSSGATQFFNFINSTNTTTFTNISFFNNCSMDVTGSGLVVFNFSDSSQMLLEGTAQASNATLNANDTSLISFQDTSQAQSAAINLNDMAILNFINSSIAGSSSTGFQTTVNASGTAAINFNNSSDPNNAIINLHNGSSLTFNTSIGTSGHGGPFITLFNTSSMTLLQNISIATLNSLSTNTHVNLGTHSLTIEEPSGENDVYAGLITGTGQLIISDVDTTASLTLTQAQNPADTWRANVLVGTLVGNTSNLNRAIMIGPQGSVVFEQRSNGVFNKSITGTGTLFTMGPGNLKITSNNSSFAGTTDVLSGTLNLTGSLGGHINVFSKLTGNGIAAGTVEVHNGGIISPDGNKVGTLTVGDYINDNRGIYHVDVNDSRSDLIHATTVRTNGTGTATLLGGIVVVHPENHHFLANCPYTIVKAQNGVTGRYTGATGFSQFIRPVLTYDPHHVFLTLKANFEPFAKTHNQKAVAAQIDTVHGCSPNLLIEDLAFLSPNQLREALDELSGEQYTALIPTLQKANQRFIRAINLPIRLNMFDPCDPPCEREGFWADIQYGRSFVKSNNNAKGYSVKIIDGFVATQMKLAPCFTGGVAMFYENDFFEFDLSGNAHTNTFLGSLFGVYQNNSLYALGDLLFGYSFNKLKRHIDFDDFHESTKGDSQIYDAGFYGEIGANFSYLPCLLLQPFAAVELDYFYRRQFRESGAGIADLRLKNQEYRGVDTFAGLRGKAVFGGLEAIAEASWQHRFFNKDFNSINSRFEQFGNEFKIVGPKQGQDGILGSVMLALNAMDGRKVFAEVYGEKWSHYSDYGFSVGFDINW
jgi:fibronectin-binding autotransporter adhesin